jgi:hypothetical protein
MAAAGAGVGGCAMPSCAASSCVIMGCRVVLLAPPSGANPPSPYAELADSAHAGGCGGCDAIDGLACTGGVKVPAACTLCCGDPNCATQAVERYQPAISSRSQSEEAANPPLLVGDASRLRIHAILCGVDRDPRRLLRSCWVGLRIASHRMGFLSVCGVAGS